MQFVARKACPGPFAEGVENDSRNQSAKYVNQVVCLNVHRGAAQEKVERQCTEKEVAAVIDQQIIRMVLIPTCDEGKAAVGRSPVAWLDSTSERKNPSGPGACANSLW